MHYTLSLLSAVVLLSIAIRVKAAEVNCTEADVTSCKNKSPWNWADLKSVLKAQHNFTVICQKVQDIKDCLTTKKCTDTDYDVLKLWEGTEHGYEYLCQEAKTHIKDLLDCLETKTAEEGLTGCNSTFSLSDKDSAEEHCKKTNARLDCYYREIQQDCKSDTLARIYKTFQDKYLTPATSVNYPTCHLDGAIIQTSILLLAAALLTTKMLTY